MANERYYDAKKYAYSLDYSHGRFHDYHRALVDNLYAEVVGKDEFMTLATEAGIDLNKPDAKSEHPHPVLWWNVDLPGYVLLAKKSEEENYWAFTRRDDELMQQLAEAFAENERAEIS